MKPKVLFVKANDTGINYLTCLLRVHNFIFYTYKDILKRKDFNQRFEHYLLKNCFYEQAKWDIRGDKITVYIKGDLTASMLIIKLDYKSKKTELAIKGFDTITDFGEINMDHFKFSYNFESHNIFSVEG